MNVKTFDFLILLLGVVSYLFGYYLLTIYTVIHICIRILQEYSPYFNNKLISFKKDQETIKYNYLKDFKLYYYFIMVVRVVTGGFYIFFFYALNAEQLEQYSFLFFSITYTFVISNFIDLIIIIYIILYKNNPIRETILNVCYHCVNKGVFAFGALHMSSNVQLINPNSVTNFYHLWSPLGRGYGAHSSDQLLQVDILKTHLGSKFDYTACIDEYKYLEPEKIKSYAKQQNIDLPSIKVTHEHVVSWDYEKKNSDKKD